MTDITSYFKHDDVRCTRPLGTGTAEKGLANGETRRERIVRLHNITNQWFYQQDETAFELRIDFDPKKWSQYALTNFQEVHKYVKNFFYLQKHISYVMMREWSPKSGNLHYHGIIYVRDNNNQTYMAKIRQAIVRQFGWRSKIKHITYPDSYIPYMFKRYMDEKELRIASSEVICSLPICSEVTQGETPLEEKYTWESLLEYKAQRLLNKRTDQGRTSIRNGKIYLFKK